MSTNQLGITFREMMSGGFTHGETDCAAGERKGKQTGSVLVMHSTITIPDLDAFISDPNHTGQLEATLDYTPFGKSIPTSNGVFKLFAPTNNPRMKHMIYEMRLQHGGQAYFLSGHKEVENDAYGLDLWKDTTTLFTKLYKGTDTAGEVAGAGILSLGVADVIDLVSTMRALNAKSPAEAAQAIGKFGKVFLGELWDTYVMHQPQAAKA